ncbi:MAG: hypothetical protein K940chlam2_00032 [Chlamydiae bacterium]|nr:hypothetical protein [Chlamydiota bacterium]
MENQNRSNPTIHSLIVLTYTRADLVTARIGELTRIFGSDPNVEIVVFDNGSTNLEVKLALSNVPPSVRVERVQDNLGFGGGWNEAVSRSTGDFIHLISDDVRVYGNIVAHIERNLGNRPMWTGSGTGLVVGQTIVGPKAGWNEFAGTTIEYLMGHYLVMAREVWSALEGFDTETFHPNDYEDMDLSHRARQAGFDLVAIPDLPIEHLVAGTIGYNPTRYEHTVKMRAAFAKKWNLQNIPTRPGE